MMHLLRSAFVPRLPAHIYVFLTLTLSLMCVLSSVHTV